MSKICSLLIRSAIVACVIGTAFDAGAAQNNKNASSKFGTPLTTDELFQLYHSRSWLWNDGAGYFSPKQRRFTAATGAGSGASIGDGQWFLTDPGKLCFKATWTAKSGSAPALTCFSHRRWGAKVYQRREPDGEWYLFKHSPIRKADEYAKVRPGNYIGTRFNNTKARLANKS
jgi:Protein of unknown function (DUF995)